MNPLNGGKSVNLCVMGEPTACKRSNFIGLGVATFDPVALGAGGPGWVQTPRNMAILQGEEFSRYMTP